MRRIIVLFAIACACGGGDGGGKAVDAGPNSGPDADPSEYATIMGSVWVPGNAPGLVPAGHEIPVFDAVVYLTSERPDALEEGASCRPCTEAPGNSVLTDHDGNFVLYNVVPNSYWLIIEKGDFRLEQQIEVAPRELKQLQPEQTTLPSVYDPANGKTIPKIALASGIFDDMEDILGKIALGEVDSTGGFVPASAAGVFDIYSNGGKSDGVAVGTLGDLVGSLERMLDYDIIFIPCSGSSHTAALQDINVLRNIRDYVAAGGKLYVTDWSGEWSDNVFPAQVELSGVDTPAAAYDPINDTWNPALFGSANGSPSYTSNMAEAVDGDLATWLEGQSGPYAEGGAGPFVPTDMTVEGNWNHITGLQSVNVGVDEEGNPIMDTPVKYVVGDDGTADPKKPLTVTFEPAGCGRVLYSTYHTTHSTHSGLAPQERILVYLIMEIGVCKDGPIID